MSNLENLDESSKPKDTASFYDSVAADYHQQYQLNNLAEGKKYPQNYFRLQILIKRVKALGICSIYEVGTGEGTPLAMMAEMGCKVAGCDISPKMVEQTQKRLKRIHVPSNVVQWGNIEEQASIANQTAYGPFDALFALGVMPHVLNDEVAINNMRQFVRPGGRLFIEFRNKLFSLFTFNRYTKEFILNDLLLGVREDVKGQVARDLDNRLEMSQPSLPEGSLSYSDIQAKFHNPFEVQDLFKRMGFGATKIHWYHFHPAPPFLEPQMKQQYWLEASRLEYDESWRGYFLCSAFVIEVEV